MEYSLKNISRSFLKKVVLIFLFFTITPITLLASIFSLISISNPNHNENVKGAAFFPSDENQKALVYTASTNKYIPSVSGQIVAGDGRPQILNDFFDKHNSPLKPYADLIVLTSDKYGLDYRLLTAIAQKESGLCRVIPEGSHNCWGWGIHSKGTLMFDSYTEAIETVAKGIRENYLDKGYVTPEQIMKKYAHPDSTTWAEGVSAYMDELE